MAEYWQLDYGYKVKVLNGKDKDKTGWIVYGSRMGDICINTHKAPKNREYQIREPPQNLEILSMDDPYNLKRFHEERDLSNFECAKLDILIRCPKLILMRRQYFDEKMILIAKKSLVSDLTINSKK